MNRVSLQPGFVLHHYPYRNTSLLVEAFTPDHGRIGLIARGARAGKSAIRALLQPFRALRLSWSGKGDLYTLTGVEPDHCWPQLEGKQLLCGFYLNELILRLTEREDVNSEAFQIYHATLVRLAAGVPLEPLLREFEVRFLAALGYALILDHDVVSGEPIDSAAEYLYLLERGPTRSEPGLTINRRLVLRISGECLLALHRLELKNKECLEAAKRLTRLALQRYLGDRPLKTRELFRKVYPTVDSSAASTRSEKKQLVSAVSRKTLQNQHLA